MKQFWIMCKSEKVQCLPKYSGTDAMLVPIKEMGTVVHSLSLSNDRSIKAAELDQNNTKCNLRDIPKTQSIEKHQHHHPGIRSIL